MNKVVIAVETDAETKRAIQKLCQDFGLTPSSLINNYLKQVVINHSIKSRHPELMTPKLERLLEEAEESIKRGEVSKPHDNIKDFLDNLKS